MKLDLAEHVTLKFDAYEKLNPDQKLKIFSVINQLNLIIDEVDDDDKVLHIYNVPPELVSNINAYNRTQRGPTGKPINITAVCVNALQSTLNDIDEKWNGTAEEMEDPPEDEDGNELHPGDHVSFTITGPDAYNHFKGIVFMRLDEYCIKSGEQNWIINNELLNLRKIDKPYTMDDYERK